MKYLCFIGFFNSCTHTQLVENKTIAQRDTVVQPILYADMVIVSYNVEVGKYFHFTDSLVKTYTPSVNYPLTEHLLMRANSWVIDSLVETDL